MEEGEVAFRQEKYKIHISEVIDVLVKAGYKKKVEITSDSCYAGKICLEACLLWQQDTEKKGIRSFETFKIEASTEPNKKAAWGEYTKYKKIKHGEDSNEIEVHIAFNKYIEYYGVA